MEEVNITQTESRYFGDLFLCCDVEKTGKIPIQKATDMFRSANLSTDVLIQITSLAGIPSAALHISRVQFYSCLKLIAAQQASIPLRQELLPLSVQLPLPRFSWKDSPTQLTTKSTTNSTTSGTTELNGVNGNVSGSIGSSLHYNDSWTQPNRYRRHADLIELQRCEAGNSDLPSTDSEVEQNDLDTIKRSRRPGDGSPEAWSTASDSPTPTNSVAERPWAQGNLWQGLLCEEQRQLLGTEEESSDRHSSDDDNETELETIYEITSEQREYYVKQFKAIQPEPNGLVSGHVARVFFEKSRIPVEELRHIWQLCDVTKDGALSLAEFTAAMHLVVLRRNNIPLPPLLPACLMPSLLQPQTSVQSVLSDPPEADLLHLDDDQTDGVSKSIMQSTGSSDTSSTAASVVVTGTKPIQSSSTGSVHQKSTQNSPPLKSQPSIKSIHSTSSTTSPLQYGQYGEVGDTSLSSTVITSPAKMSSNTQQAATTSSKDWINQSSKEWTKFTESPTSNVSSPGPKPVNFDMQRTAQAVVSDPLILHPVPLRVTPVAQSDIVEPNDSNGLHRKSDSLIYDGGVITIRDPDTTSPKHMHQHVRDSTTAAIQRPQAKKLLTKVSVGALPPPPQRESGGPLTTISDVTVPLDSSQIAANQISNNSVAQTNLVNKKEPPPPPPPRPHRHARSSSLDLNKLKLGGASLPPEIPPRVSPQMVTQTSLDATRIDVANSSFADFTQFPETINVPPVIADEVTQNPIANSATVAHHRQAFPFLQSSQRSSAFEVYRKPTPRSGLSTNSPENHSIYSAYQSVGSSILSGLPPRNDKSISEVMRHLKEQNALLLRVCSDLSDELLSIQQRREELYEKLMESTKSAAPDGTGSSSGSGPGGHQSIV